MKKDLDSNIYRTVVDTYELYQVRVNKNEHIIIQSLTK